MKISTLQSLIDRTSNDIANYESAIKFELAQRIGMSDFELEQSEYTVKYYKAKLPKLREIQKDLKCEIAYEIDVRRINNRAITFSVKF